MYKIEDSTYNKWNALKKNISCCKKPLKFREKEIFFVSMGQNIDTETYGKGDKVLRPVVILRKFNRHSFFGIPLSSKIKDGYFYHLVTYKNKINSALISQARVFDAKRLEYKSGELSTKEYEKIKDKFVEMINPSKKEGSGHAHEELPNIKEIVPQNNSIVDNSISYQIEDLNFMVSLFCPGKCLNCNIWQYDKNEVRRDEIALSLFERVLSSKYLANTNYFDLTAGESQLSPKYVDVVRAIATSKPNAFVHTNISGWYPKEHLKVTQVCLQYIKKENFRVDISLDGSEENYKKVRLVKNGYKKVLETIELLKPLGIKIRVVFIVHKQNYKDIAWIKEFAEQNGIDYFIGYSRNASLLQNRDSKINYSKQELENIESSLESIAWLDERRKPNWLWAKSIYQDNVPLFECYMGQKALVLDPYGNLFPCNECLDELNMGNIKDYDGDLDSLLESQKALSVIEDIKAKKCQPCGMLCAHKIEFPWGSQAGLQKSP
jgi:radical SAM protein with 4Fe4S-binding SPASM domain